MAKRVLIIDDDQDILNRLSALLRRDGWAVQTGTSMGDAINLYDEFRPDVLLLDLNLPGSDGFAVLGRLQARKARGGANTRIIIISGREAAEDMNRALAGGAADYLVKPINPDELLRRIRRQAPEAAR
jgi:DNA-binding response OmpR family regulator